MTLTLVSLLLVVLTVGMFAMLVFYAVPLAVKSSVTVDLSVLRNELARLDEERPGTFAHSDVKELDGLIRGYLRTGGIGLSEMVGAVLTVRRIRARQGMPAPRRRYEGIGLDHRAGLSRIESELMLTVTKGVLLGNPLWFITGWLWVAIRPVLRRARHSRRAKQSSNTQRRTIRLINTVVYVGAAGTDSPSNGTRQPVATH